MAICKKCKKKYIQKECPFCNDKDLNTTIVKTQKKENKTLLIIIAIAVSIIALIMIRNEISDYQNDQMVKKFLYGTTDNKKIEIKNKKIMKNFNYQMKEYRKTINKLKQRNH